MFFTASSPNTISEVVIDGKTIAETELAEAFNDYFVSLSFSAGTGDISRYLTNPCSDTIFLHAVTEAEVYSTIMHLKNSSCTDSFDIQVRPVKFVADIIARPLSHIFNICLSTGTFPAAVRTAKITVIYKKGDKNNLGNYRPISILPVLSKAFEKLLHSRLSTFTDKYNLMSDSQYGFRKTRSTELALLTQKEFIAQEIENKKIVLGIFVDFTKAFDSLNRELLLQKLQYYGIRGTGLQLIQSYLSNRHQYVAINKYVSSTKSTAYGVPQGSILGPFLFNIYINDIVQIDPRVKFIIYADDTTLLISNDDCDKLISQGNKILG